MCILGILAVNAAYLHHPADATLPTKKALQALHRADHTNRLLHVTHSTTCKLLVMATHMVLLDMVNLLGVVLAVLYLRRVQ